MRVLFTGASSFTGYWFVHELAHQGHEVYATFTRPRKDYDDLRGRRVERVVESCSPTWGCCFGDDQFLAVIDDVKPEILCHHAADVTDYKSPDFDYVRALSRNTHRLADVLGRLEAIGCRRIVTTGSVFEAEEGAGEAPLVNFSPYGLSKSLTDRVFRYHAAARGLALAKFVIPNPFGPLEDPRFTAYLVRCWRERKVAEVRTPDYVRDNIHVSLLAKSYALVVSELRAEPGSHKTNPSGYVETQGAFAERFAREIRSRLDWPCELRLCRQTEFLEPHSRINTTRLDGDALEWNESDAWDAIAEYYGSAGEKGAGHG